MTLEVGAVWTGTLASSGRFAPGEPPPVLYHGTYYHREAIEREGLRVAGGCHSTPTTIGPIANFFGGDVVFLSEHLAVSQTFAYGGGCLIGPDGATHGRLRGQRRVAPPATAAVFEIDAARASRDGIVFYPASPHEEHGTWLVESIPREYLRRLDDPQ